MMEDITKNIIFTNAIGANVQPATTIQYQTADGTILKQPKIEGQKDQQPTFYYTTTTANGNAAAAAAAAVNLAQLTTTTTDDNKTCYIAPVGGYSGFALVNPGMQLNQSGAIGIATVDAQGRLQIVNQNKPLATTLSPLQNSISNISFKCDICGLMFHHLALLNHHKRVHAQEQGGVGDQQHQQQQQHQHQQQQQHQPNQSDGIGGGGGSSGLVQTQNIITENGQMGQIQIVATDALEPANTVLQQQHQQHHPQAGPQHHQQQHPQTTEVSSVGKSLKLEHNKCLTCGQQFLQPIKRKGAAKVTRCDSCIQGEQAQQALAAANNQQAQFLVTQDGEIKFEMNDMPSNSESSMDSLNAQNMLQNHMQPVQILTTTAQGQHQLQLAINQANANIKRETGTPNNECPTAVKKKSASAKVAKCGKCNGSGVVFIGTGAPAHKHPGGTNMGNAKSDAPKPFTCNICGGNFSRYSSLWSHKKLHSGEKNYKCTICGLAFAKAVYLKNHARIHTGEKPYKCQTCGMQFSQSPHLKNHERTHSGERPYVCEVCDKGFARHATLWNHRRIHTGEKPYKCEICGSAFSQAAHLKNHAKVHSGEKPFKCDICSAAFADRFALKRHRGIHEKYGQTAPRQPAQLPRPPQADQQTIRKTSTAAPAAPVAPAAPTTTSHNTNGSVTRRPNTVTVATVATVATAATSVNSVAVATAAAHTAAAAAAVAYHQLQSSSSSSNSNNSSSNNTTTHVTAAITIPSTTTTLETSGVTASTTMKIPNYHTTAYAPHNLYYPQQAAHTGQPYGHGNFPTITDVIQMNTSSQSAYMPAMMSTPHHHKSYH